MAMGEHTRPSTGLSVALHGLPAGTIEKSIVALLQVITPGQFDLVLVLGRHAASSQVGDIPYAVINFINASAAAAFCDFIETLNQYEDKPIQIVTSKYRGWGLNLAYLMARFGWDTTAWPLKPLLFCGGVLQTQRQMLKIIANIPASLLFEGQAVVSAEMGRTARGASCFHMGQLQAAWSAPVRTAPLTAMGRAA
mmetsp:Transcript_45464/g.106254  ORF Transcript_45464/g.106254 Transcript_45464/m.106254 type:complete len:195 (+) Transcript_45464:73-657(+)